MGHQRKDKPEPCQLVLVWLVNVKCIAEIAETGAGVSETGLVIGPIWYTTDERPMTPCNLWPSGRGMSSSGARRQARERRLGRAS